MGVGWFAVHSSDAPKDEVLTVAVKPPDAKPPEVKPQKDDCPDDDGLPCLKRNVPGLAGSGTGSS